MRRNYVNPFSIKDTNSLLLLLRKAPATCQDLAPPSVPSRCSPFRGLTIFRKKEHHFRIRPGFSLFKLTQVSHMAKVAVKVKVAMKSDP